MRSKTVLGVLSVLALFGGAQNARSDAAVPPCKILQNTCAAAGFKKAGHKAGQGLGACFESLVAGKPVTSMLDNKTPVTAPPDAVSGCIAERAKAKPVPQGSQGLPGAGPATK
jgi:hypothetical protein